MICDSEIVGSIFTNRENPDHISSKRGGDGAVREFIEWIINKDK